MSQDKLDWLFAVSFACACAAIMAAALACLN
jgi:hypothetical protein